MVIPPEMEGDAECVELANAAWDAARTQYKRIFDRRYRQRVVKSIERTLKEGLIKCTDLETSSTDDLAKLLTRDERTAHRKASRQEARCVLPNATTTKIVMTGNIRSWRHVLEMRGSLAADAEIRKLAIALYLEFSVICPVFFEDFSLAMSPEGVQYLTCEYHKV
jgi:thymidylate synthase (FAD)